MRNINLIVIHCSATREDKEYTPEQLNRDHWERGFDCAGYHYYIRKNGKVVHFRPVQSIGAHAKGYNERSIGVCYEGGLDVKGKPADTRTLEQRIMLEKILKELLLRFPNCDICGHRDLSKDKNRDGVISPDEWMKVCPCFDAKNEYRPLVVANQMYLAKLNKQKSKKWRERDFI